MKKTLILLCTFCLSLPAAAQSGKLIKPAAEALSAKGSLSAASSALNTQQAYQLYMQAARNYQRFTPPLVSSDYVLRNGRKLQFQASISSNSLQKKLSSFMQQRLDRLQQLKEQKEEAFLNYGRVLAAEQGWTDKISNMPSPLPDMFPRHIAGNTQELPFQKYVHAITSKNYNEKAFQALTVEQKAVLSFLQKDLKETSHELFIRLGHPDPFGEATSLSFATANRLVQTTLFMMRYPHVFKPQLFELNVLVDKAPQTPFNDYLRGLLKTDPNYPTYYRWIRAEETGINFTSFDQMYKMLSGKAVKK